MDTSARDVVYALVLLQAAVGLLGVVGEVLFMGTLLYAVVPVAKAIALLVAASGMLRGRRWAMILLLVFEGLSLAGVWISLLVGLLPAFERSVTLTGGLTEVGLPIAVILLCAWQVARREVRA